MSRAVALTLLSVFFTACTGVASVLLGLSSLPLVPGVILVAYTAIVDIPTNAAVSAALIGLSMDALSGSPLGLNVLACVSLLLASRFFLGWVPAPRGIPGVAFVAAMSAAYAFLSLLLLFLFQRREGFGAFHVVSTAGANALACIALFPLIQRILVALRLEERSTSLRERFASKG